MKLARRFWIWVMRIPQTREDVMAEFEAKKIAECRDLYRSGGGGGG